MTTKCIAATVCSASLVFAAAPLPGGAGRKTVETVCAACHSLEIVTDKRWDREQWQIAVNEMIGFGAKLSKRQATKVVDYLAGYFGKPDRGKQLVEDVCIYCHSLQKLEGQQRTKEEWRDLIKGMISEGAPVTDEEFGLIVDYLARNFGKKDP